MKLILRSPLHKSHPAPAIPPATPRTVEKRIVGPGKSAGDEVHFDFAYFSGSRVLALPHQALGGLLAGPGTLEIGPRV